MRRQLGAAQPGVVPQVHGELRPRSAALQNERSALSRRLLEDSTCVQLVTATNVAMGRLDRLEHVGPDIVDRLRFESATYLLRGQAVLFGEGIDLGMDAALEDRTVWSALAIVVARRVQRHDRVA